jgi:hypothetical protein
MNEAENLRGELSAIHENSETTIKLANLAAVTQRDRQDLMSEAIDRLYRIYIGDPSTGTPDEWTGPFSKKYSDRPAEVVVRQVGPATFKLREPFKYVDRGRRFDVPIRRHQRLCISTEFPDLADTPIRSPYSRCAAP